MTAGSALGTAATLGVAAAPSVTWFAAAWVVAGIAQAGTLYAPAFTALTRWYGPARIRALTVLTLVAGLSSTIFAPATAALLTRFGWRETYVLLAVVLALTRDPRPRPRPERILAGGRPSVRPAGEERSRPRRRSEPRRSSASPSPSH